MFRPFSLKKTIICDCLIAKRIKFICRAIKNDRKLKKEDLLKKVGLKIRELRLSQEISLQELADMIDIEYNNLIRIEKGRTNPTVATLFKISQALNVRLLDLVDIEE